MLTTSLWGAGQLATGPWATSIDGMVRAGLLSVNGPGVVTVVVLVHNEAGLLATGLMTMEGGLVIYFRRVVTLLVGWSSL